MRRLALAAAALLIASALALSGALVPSPGRAAHAGDGTCGEAVARGSVTWYFAEGYTGPGFQEYLCVLNPQERQSVLEITFLYDGEPSRRVEAQAPARTRTTLNINELAGEGREVSLLLESGEPVVAERPMYFTYRGAWKGCTATGGADSLSNKWYFAEGCTRPGFETWVLLANPGESATAATVYFVLEDGSVIPVRVELPPLARRTVFVNEAVGEGRDVSARVEAEGAICAERVVYFDYHGIWPGGHASSGLSAPRRTYLFAEGYTGAGFEEWLTLYAPRDSVGDDGADITIDCLFQEAGERSFPVHLDPDRRHTLNVNQLAGPDMNVSLEISSQEPILAERPMYFNYRGVCRGGHVSKGVEGAGTLWYLAEGTTRPGFHEYLCIVNPGEEDAMVAVDFAWAAENSLRSELAVPARSRATVDVRGSLPTGADVSAVVTSDHPIAVERPLYYPGTAFEVANAMDHIRHLSMGIGPRVEGTPEERAAAEYLASVLRGYGYRVRIQDVPLPNGAFTCNVIAEPADGHPPSGGNQPGVPAPPVYVLCGAHLDTKMGTGSPGANDNASGTAVVLELARCMAESDENVYPVFVLFGGEERLVEGSDLHHFGSRFYVNSLTEEEKGRLLGAVIVDMVGVGSQLYARTMGVGPMDLCNRLMAYARGAGISLPYLVSGSYSDHEPFEAAGIPAVWLEVKDDPWYHTPQDSYDKISPAHIENTGRLLVGFLGSLD